MTESIDWGNANKVPQPVIAPNHSGSARPTWLCISDPDNRQLTIRDQSDEPWGEKKAQEATERKVKRDAELAERRRLREIEIDAARAERKLRAEEQKLNRELRHKLAQENKAKYAGQHKRKRRIPAPAPVGYTQVNNLAHLAKPGTIREAARRGHIPSIKNDGVYYVDEKAATVYAMTMAERRKQRGKDNWEAYKAKAKERPEGVPEGYVTIYQSRCGMSYRGLHDAAIKNRIPSLVHEGKRYIDEAAATEYARQSKRARGKQNAEA